MVMCSRRSQAVVPAEKKAAATVYVRSTTCNSLALFLAVLWFILRCMRRQPPQGISKIQVGPKARGDCSLFGMPESVSKALTARLMHAAAAGMLSRKAGPSQACFTFII